MRRVEVVRESGGWTPGEQALARRAGEAALRCGPEKIGKRGVCLVLADERCLWRLNRAYARKDAPTDVLAFPAGFWAGFLGDVVVAYERARRPYVLCALVIHGVLHLLGYDHDHPHAARRMEICESRTLVRLGIKPHPRTP